MGREPRRWCFARCVDVTTTKVLQCELTGSMTTENHAQSLHKPAPGDTDGSERASLVDNPLSEREMDVVRLLATGASNSEIARDLIISPHTVKVHLRNIFEKLEVSSRTEASMVLVQRGWLTVPGVDVKVADSAVVEPLPMPELPPEPPPEPEALADLPPQLQRWQSFLLPVAILACLIVLFLPELTTQGYTSPPLLSDSAARRVGQPEIVLEPRWEERTPLAQARSRLAVVTIDTLLFAIGGEAAGGRIVNSVDAYDLQVNQWRTAAPLPTPLSNLAAAAFPPFVFVAGGNLPAAQVDAPPGFSDRLWRYTVATNRWDDAGKLPAPVAGAALVADGVALYLIGGWDGETMRREIWSATPQPDGAVIEWALFEQLEDGRAFLGATIVDRDLYVVGGFDGQRELSQADVLNLETRGWRSLPPMSEARSGFSMVFDGLAIYALGGGWVEPVTTHERFDPVLDAWSNFASPVMGEWRHLAAAAYDGRLHLIGGWSRDYLDVHMEYQSTFRALLPMITKD